MKALTVWQPWASLLACGAKKFETRNWYTSYRGPIAIHAGLAFDNSFPDGFAEVAHAALKKSIPGFTYMHELPRGLILATAELVGCYPIGKVGWTGSTERRIAWSDGQLNPHYPSEREVLFGDWTSGRYAWEIANVNMLDVPIPAKGMQGLWNWEAPDGSR